MDVLRRMTVRAPEVVGSPLALLGAIGLVAAWVACGALVGWGTSWLLWPSAIASVVTFLIVFGLQYTQNRDTRAIQLKLDEILRTSERARSDLVKLERLSDAEMSQIEENIIELRDQELGR